MPVRYGVSEAQFTKTRRQDTTGALQLWVGTDKVGAELVDVALLIIPDEVLGMFVATHCLPRERCRFVETIRGIVVGELQVRTDVAGDNDASVRNVERVADNQSM